MMSVEVEEKENIHDELKHYYTKEFPGEVCRRLMEYEAYIAKNPDDGISMHDVAKILKVMLDKYRRETDLGESTCELLNRLLLRLDLLMSLCRTLLRLYPFMDLFREEAKQYDYWDDFIEVVTCLDSMLDDYLTI